jgi:hypothetical protein
MANRSRIDVTTSETMFSPQTGDYFSFERDKLGSGVEFDAVWEAKVSSGSIRVMREDWCNPSGDRLREWCTHGDERLDIWVGAKPLEFSGHNYFFMMGNVRRESTVDLTTLRAVLASVREVKAPNP